MVDKYPVRYRPEEYTPQIEHYLDRASIKSIDKLAGLLVSIFQIKPLSARACIYYWRYLRGL